MPRILPPDHPQRYPMTLELHARPFPTLTAPVQAIHLAFKPDDDHARDTSGHRAHLEALVDRFGAPRPAKDAQHYFGEVGRVKLKWERHTEFVSYTLFEEGEPGEKPFAKPIDELAPADWLAAAPGSLLSAIRVHVQSADTPEQAEEIMMGRYMPFFIAESLAAAHVVDRQAAVMGDFRIHEDGFTRFAVLAAPDTGPRRLGRIVQRLIEIENYRLLAMLALPVAREVSAKLGGVEAELSDVIAEIAEDRGADRDALSRLTKLSAEIESLSSQTAFRFAASSAYAALVEQRIGVLREERAASRQLVGEFMSRRFEPAMRTCRAAERRLAESTARAARAAALLSTRVNVAVETQNQDLLTAMNRRAELQLRLQRTVEGLSVVAISYYAVSLAGYVLKPLASLIDVEESAVVALSAIPIVAIVWFFIQRIHHSMEKESG